jgi:uncharacterized protein YuzE
MEKKLVNLWYDEEGDFLEVTWDRNPGYFTETEDDRIMVNLDMEGNVQGFHIVGLSSIQSVPVNVNLVPSKPKNTPEEIEGWKKQSRLRTKRRQK